MLRRHLFYLKRVGKSGEKRGGIKGDGFEGEMNREGSDSCGGLAGMVYRGKLETDKGEKRIGVLVSKAIDYSLN